MDETTLPLLLRELKLSAFLKHWKRLQEEAISAQWTHEQFLSALCEQEIAERYSQRIHRFIRDSGLPKGKTFSSLNMTSLAASVVKQIKPLQTDTRWALQARNLVLVGPSGLGKSHLSAAFGYALIEKGVKVRYFPAVALVQYLQQAKQALTLMDAMTALDKYPLIVVDDIGYVRKTEMETSVLFEFIAHRYESGSLIITANQPFSEWDSIFTDSIMTVAAIDRLIHHATIIQLEGESYRKKQHLK